VATARYGNPWIQSYGVSGPYYVAQTYWYYCPTYQSYYPQVTSCPVPWVTVGPGGAVIQ
jgi:hypothetical protein